MIESVAVEAIVAAVEAQYFEELKEYYVGYKNQTIKTMVTQIRMWYVIATKENLASKSHFLATCSDTPDAHVTTFERQLDRRQDKCKYHGVTITDFDKLDHFVAQM